MVTKGNAGDGNGNRHKGGKGRGTSNGKHARFSDQQVEIFEKVYAEYQNPTRLQRLQMVDDYPVLKDVDIKQIKVWFQNRRCREKLRKEMIELQAANQLLIATNNILTEENDLLQKKVKQLVCENEYLRHKLKDVDVPSGNAEVNSEPAPYSPQLSLSPDDSDTSLNLLAEETMEEFLLKAKGAAIEWVPISGIKPCSNSTGIVYVSRNCVGMAARACAVVPLGPVKIMEILKERASWTRDCRNVEIFAKFQARNGGTIELVYTQFYALTTVASARDFWTLRYTSALEDGSLVVCEKSLSGSHVPMNAPAPLEFIRAKMLASGFLIRPYASGLSTIHIIDHLDLEATSVPYMLQPLYESSELLAQKITVAALGHLELMAKEVSGKLPQGSSKDPDNVRSFSLRLSRSFNDAINTFTEDGWSLMDYNASEDLVISTKPTRNLGIRSKYDGILCVKASMLLENVSPVMLVQLLRDHHSDWADIPRHLSDSGVLLGHTVNEDEILEIIRVDDQDFCWKDYFRGSLYLLQICNGIEANGIGACSELIFAPIEEKLPDDAMLLSSGFRILSLGLKNALRVSLASIFLNLTKLPEGSDDSLHNYFLKKGHGSTIYSAEWCNGIGNWSKNLAAYMNERASPSNSDRNLSLPNNSLSVLVTAFQFPFQNNRREDVAVKALRYMHHVISSVLKLARATTPPASLPERGINVVPDSDEAVHLAYVICQSYRLYIGCELLSHNTPSNDSLLELLWHHQDAILCWSFQGILQPFSSCLFANQAGLEMQEMTLADLPDISLDKIIAESGMAAPSSVFPMVMQKGYALLPGGICLPKTRCVSYEQAVAWRVLRQVASMPCIAFAFINWSFT